MSAKTEALFERWVRAKRDHPNAPVYVGAAARADGVHHWTEADVQNGRFSPAERASVDWNVAPLKRRTPAERLKEATDRIADQALKQYRLSGVFSLPRSVLVDVQAELAKQGYLVSEAELERFTADQIRPLIERYAAAVLQRCENKYEANKGLTPLVRGA